MNRKARRLEKKLTRQGAHALSPALAAVFTQAVADHQAGRLAEAEVGYRQILAANSAHADSLHLMGVIAQQVGQLAVAEALIAEAVALDGAIYVYRANLGHVLRALGCADEAMTQYKAAFSLEPGSAQAHHDLALGLRAAARFDEAADHAGRAIAARPDFPEAFDNLGSILADQGRLDEAVAAYRQAIALRADYAEAHNNISTVLKEQGLQTAAVDAFRAAVRLDPDFANAHNNLAMALLARGAFEEGWREYEWRWRTPRMAPGRRGFAQPRWRGEPGEGRAILVHAEQGFGDTIQFCRYAPLIAARGLRVILEVPAPLTRLARQLDGVDDVIRAGAPLPRFQLHCPMLSLPLAFDTRLETIPAKVPYLAADPEETQRWSRRLGAAPGLKVGVAWTGNPNTTAHARRCLPRERLAALVATPGVRFISLQKEASEPDLPILDLMDEVGDFASTAALIANLDLVISVDTAVAHLAGAIGRPVWLMDRFDPDWRWLLGRRDSPWYPTLTIYRQPSAGDWGAVIQAVVQDLRKRAATG